MSVDTDKLRDAELVRSALKGDRRALQRLVDHYHGPVYNIAYRILSDREAAADATQTAFLLAFENLDKYDPEHKFFSWIYRIAVNEAVAQSKKRQRYQQPVPEEKAAEPDSDPAGKASQQEINKLLESLLMDLQEDYRTVLILRHFLELSYREIAAVIELPVKTVRSRLYSARQLMKSQLEHRGINYGDQ